MGRIKQVVSFGGVFFTDQDFETQAAPGEMVAHAAGSVGLNHSVNAGGFESALGKIGFDLRGEAVDDRELTVIHGNIIRLTMIGSGARKKAPAALPDFTK